MIVLFINTADIKGGAAIAAVRLANGLEVYKGFENHFIVGDKYSENYNVLPSRNNKYQTFIERRIDRICNKIGFQYSFFPFSRANIINAIKRIRPDIVSLHNTHGGYFQTNLLEEISGYAPIVWTLHDMWSFNGNSAYAFDDDSWKYMKQCKYPEYYPSIGVNTTAWLLKQKKNIYKKSNLTIITPSKWLFNLAMQAPVFEGKSIHQIFNGIDLEIFKPIDKHACRKALGFDPQEKVLMFCSQDLKDSVRKSGDRFLHLLTDIDVKLTEKVNVLVVGKGEVSKTKDFKMLKIWHINYLDNERLLAACYSASDLLIHVTAADNLPNVLVESIACGTAAIGCDIGGCGEIIRDGKSGFLFKPDDMNSFTNKVVELLGQKEILNLLSIQARNFSENNFSIQMMCDNYMQVFKKVLNS